MTATPPINVLLVFADQMRGDAMGCAGNAAVRTPNLDRLAAEGTRFARAFAETPVCTPSRGSLLTGLYPLGHGAVVNDIPIRTDVPSIGTIFRDAGYATGYVGKWHLDGVPRNKFTPPGPRRLGFDDCWAVHNCTHNYPRSFYYGDTPEPIPIDGYEPEHQTDLAIRFMERCRRRPFCLVLSWGPPHDPYETAPERFRAMYPPGEIELRPNVPARNADDARRDIAGYYAHVTALDELMGRLLAAMDRLQLARRTLVVFTSDHGDMLLSHGQFRKQRPWDESIGVPLILRKPGLVPAGRVTDDLIGLVDLLPTALGLTGVSRAAPMDGCDLSAAVTGRGSGRDEVLIMNPWAVDDGWRQGIREWRGLRTPRYTYARTIDSPWVLYDNAADPYQFHNLAADGEYVPLMTELDDRLRQRLKEIGDPFLRWDEMVRRYGLVDAWNARERELHGERGRSLAPDQA